MTDTPQLPEAGPELLPAPGPGLHVPLPGDLDPRSGATPHGWPYIGGDDHPIQYPVVSQSLAQKLDQVPFAGGAQLGTDPGLVFASTVVANADSTGRIVVAVGPFRAGTRPIVIPTAASGAYSVWHHWDDPRNDHASAVLAGFPAGETVRSGFIVLGVRP